MVDDVAKAEDRSASSLALGLDGRKKLVAHAERMFVGEKNVRPKRLDGRPQNRRPNGNMLGERDRKTPAHVDVVMDLPDPRKLQHVDAGRDAKKADWLYAGGQQHSRVGMEPGDSIGHSQVSPGVAQPHAVVRIKQKSHSSVRRSANRV